MPLTTAGDRVVDSVETLEISAPVELLNISIALSVPTKTTPFATAGSETKPPMNVVHAGLQKLTHETGYAPSVPSPSAW